MTSISYPTLNETHDKRGKNLNFNDVYAEAYIEIHALDVFTEKSDSVYGVTTLTI